ncbi:endonuclease, partial [Vibrio vulnificus]
SDAILSENQLKKWNRQRKIQLIESANPHWLDLYKNLRTTIR